MGKSSRCVLDLKLIFDAVILLLLLYSTNVISMQVHEIAGLVLIGLFVVHVLFNRRWVANVTRKLFGKSVSARIRVGYLVNLLLVISFLLMGVSGALISHKNKGAERNQACPSRTA